MSDYSDTPTYVPSQGTIAGFTSADLNTVPENVRKTGWSTQELYNFLLQSGVNGFFSPDWFLELEQLILTHLKDFDNPHEVTLDQIMPGIISAIMANITPGTPPTLPPFFAFDANNPLPLNTIFPASYTITNAYRVTESGEYIDTSTDPLVMGVDYMTGRAGVPLYPALNDYILPTWTTPSLAQHNSTITPVTHPSVTLPFQFYRIDETNATGEIGVSISVNEAPSTDYAFTILLAPLYIDGTLVVRQKDDAANCITIDVATGATTASSANVTGSAILHPNGLMRISFNYRSKGTPLGKVEILHQRAGDTQLTRVGSPGQMLFLIANPCASMGGADFPVSVVRNQPLVTSSFNPQMSVVQAPARIAKLMVNLVLTMRPLPDSSVAYGQVILSFDRLTIARTATQIMVKYNGTFIAQAPILDGLNIISVSYSPTQIMLKTLNTTKQVISGSCDTLDTSNVALGPCSGYLHQVAFYGQSDDDQCLEFLTNA